LKVAALQGAPGVMSARYAFISGSRHIPVPNSLDVTVSGTGTGNAPDAENNSRLLAELDGVPESQRQARFVCVIAAARGGKTLATFRGEAEGTILNEARGSNGFGYDPLFHSMELGKTFAELSAEEKAAVSHRGRAFRKVLEWYRGEESGAGARV
jgi:XTP/dITP diphosphohydrolase